MISLSLVMSLSAPWAVASSPQLPVVSPQEQQEMRGIWLSRFGWRTQSELEAAINHISQSGFNTIFFQVRGTFDAFYQSSLEPWSDRLTGSLGQDPGWDPLATVLSIAHANNVEVHAWMNTFPIWRGEELPNSQGLTHPLQLHPEWIISDQSGSQMALNPIYVFADPSIPEVRAHVASVAGDLTRRYDVDGVHLDYIRFPEPEYGDATVARGQIEATVVAVKAAIDVPLSAAVWGIHTNRWGWERVSQGSHDYYQDSVAFMQQGLVDAIAPMIYWPVTEQPGDRLDFSTLASDHVQRRGDASVWTGISAELSYDEVAECIRASRRVGAQGFVIFDYTQIQTDMERLEREFF
jgi:uncharacterized lipoprotein YddW (UPF0748 family)